MFILKGFAAKTGDSNKNASETLALLGTATRLPINYYTSEAPSCQGQIRSILRLAPTLACEV
jgi:hypothetical protein